MPDELRKSSVVLTRAGERDFVARASARRAGAHARASIRRRRPELAAEFVHKIGKAQHRLQPRGGALLADRARARASCGQSETDERTARRRSAAPARPSSSTSPSAKARASTRSSPARRARANRRSSTSSSRISRSGARPEQVEFYLIDFKKGVEFKCYAEKPPAARARGGHRERPRICPQRAPARG